MQRFAPVRQQVRLDKTYRIVYSVSIIPQSTISNYSLNNQRDLVLDTAENLTQIGHWTLAGFAKEQKQIELYLKLTRKNLKALETFPLSPTFLTGFKKFCDCYTKLEKEYIAGLTDHKVWANDMLKWGVTLTKDVQLI